MNLRNQLPFSEKWDELLNKLMDNGEIVDHCSQTITFKLQIGTKLKGFLIKKEIPVFKEYEVWVSSKEYKYGRLWSLNGDVLPDNDQRSASIGTMERLYELEQSLISEEWYKL